MTPRHTQEPDAPNDSAWKLDRHIPIAVIFALLMQTGGAVWWMSALSSQVNTATEVNERQDLEIRATSNALSAQQVGIATAAAELRAVRDGLAEVKTAISDQNKMLRDILTNGGQP